MMLVADQGWRPFTPGGCDSSARDRSMDISLILQKPGCWSRIRIKKEPKNFSATPVAASPLLVGRFQVRQSGNLPIRRNLSQGKCQSGNKVWRGCQRLPRHTPSRLRRFTHGLAGKWVYLARACRYIDNQYSVLEESSWLMVVHLRL